MTRSTPTLAFRDTAAVRRVAAEIARITTRPWSIMEVCGGQTWAILRHGLDQLLPAGLELLHGPGCPVCVTPLDTIDRAIAIAGLPGTILATYGDMLRVPGSRGDLSAARAEGADVRVVLSPLDAVEIARREPGREVVFLAVGFETTAPATAHAVRLAARERLGNVSFLVAHVLVPPALEALLAAPGNRVQAFLAAGHVCSVMGLGQYPAVAARHRVPIVVSGFEPLDILDAVRRAVLQLEEGRAEVENAYPRCVAAAGNPHARAAIDAVFECCPRQWRGIGTIPDSGWRLTPPLAPFDAERRFPAASAPAAVASPCRSGDVLRGAIRPTECPAFGRACTPRTPLGPTMVSGEGACAAYHAAGRTADGAAPGAVS